MVLFVILYLLIYIPCMLLFPTIVKGRKNLPKKQGYILCANHTSNMDTVLLDIRLYKRLTFLGKKELCKSKFSKFMFTKVFGMIPVDRENADITAFKTVMNTLKNNKPVGIFPEGTRNKTQNVNQIQDVKAGAIVFAGKANVPIVPVVFKKKPRIFCINKLIIGEPFYIEAENPKKLTSEELAKNEKLLAEKIEALRK